MSIPTVFISYSHLDEQCSISINRLAAYTAILREYHIERDPSLAHLFAEEEVEED
jgi:hypothetical protein